MCSGFKKINNNKEKCIDVFGVKNVLIKKVI